MLSRRSARLLYCSVFLAGVVGNSPVVLAQGRVTVSPPSPPTDSVRLILAPAVGDQLLVLEFEHTLRLISTAMQDLLRVYRMDSLADRERTLFLRQAAPSVLSLQKFANDAFVRVERVCANSGGGRGAYLGVGVVEGRAGQGAVRGEQVDNYPRILRVERGSPAEKAGLDSGDVIVAVNGVDLRDRDLAMFVTDSGRTLRLSLLRAGRSRDASVTLTQPPAPAAGSCNYISTSPEVVAFFRSDSALSRAFNFRNVRVAGDSVAPFSGSFTFTLGDSNRVAMFAGRDGQLSSGGTIGVRFSAPVTSLGATFRTASPAYLRAHNVEFGVPVLLVTPNSMADRGGLRTGDFVTRVGSVKVTDLESLTAAIESAAGKSSPVDVEVSRDGKVLKLKVAMRE